MKGLDIVLKDVSYSRRALAYDLPVKAGCVGWWFLGGDIDQSAVNLAEGYPDATVIGSPAINDYYLGLKSKNNILRTEALLGSAWTLIVVGRNTDTLVDAEHQPVLIGTSGESGGGNIFHNATTTTVAMNSYPGGVSNTLTLASTPGNWKMAAAVADADNQTLYNLTLGTSDTEANSGALTPSTTKVGIGGGGNMLNSQQGTSDIAMAAIYNRVLAEAELETIYDRLKPYYAPRSISI